MWPKTYHWSLPITEENKFSFYFVLSLFFFFSLSLSLWIVCHCCCVRVRHVRLFISFYSSFLFFFFGKLSPIQRTHTWLLVCFSSFHQYKQTRTHARKHAHTYTSQWSFGPEKPAASLSSMSTVPLSVTLVLLLSNIRCSNAFSHVLLENLVRYRRDTHAHLYISSTAVIDRFLVASILFRYICT